jgi:drug/metabolite transporter (DMT)-like permease
VLDKLPMSIVSLYTYVNPVVAVTLGWIFYREPFGRRELAAMLIIFLGVYLVKRSQSRATPPTTPD